MRKRLFVLYWWLERHIHPTLRYSQNHYHDTLKATVSQGCDWLDLGCGHQMFAGWMKAEERELAARSRHLVGIDMDLRGMKAHATIREAVFGDIARLPFDTGSFDIVTANMVVEHLEVPGCVLQEVHRVLRPGGLFVFHTPNRKAVMIRIARLLPQSLKNLLVRILDGRKEDDVFRTHYAMNTAAEITRQANAAGFEINEIRSVSTNAITALTGPFSVVELCYLRMLDRHSRFSGLRSNLIATLKRTTS